jgi:hypothetical protein
MNKLKERWGIKHNYQLVVIFIVFAVTGSTSAYLSKPVLKWLGIAKDKSLAWDWQYTLLYIVLIFPIYQMLLLFFGFISGQKAFFFPIVKRMVKLVGFGFLFKNESKK